MLTASTLPHIDLAKRKPASGHVCVMEGARRAFAANDPAPYLGCSESGVKTASAGWFLTPDPLIQDPHYSQSYNRYMYVWNNPLRYTDPTGYSCRQVGGRAGLAIGSCDGSDFNPDFNQDYLDGTRIDIDYHQPDYHYRQDPLLDPASGPDPLLDPYGGSDTGGGSCGCGAGLGKVLSDGVGKILNALSEALPSDKKKSDSKDQATGAVSASGSPDPDDEDESEGEDSYENPGHHDPSGQGPNPYNRTKSVLPKKHKELWKKSVKGSDGNRSTKVGNGKKAVYHRFQNDGNGNWHWNGSTNGVTKSGASRAIKIHNVPSVFRVGR